MDVDFATLQKIYGAANDQDQRRYLPAKCIGTEMKAVIGRPILRMFPRLLWSGRTSPCACLCEVHTTDKRIFKDGWESCIRRGAPPYALQLLPRQQDSQGYACNGSRIK
jgi:hypothetical protein